MLFNSFEFLIFLPIIVFGFYFIDHKYRWGWLLLGSYLFYSFHEPELLILLLISTITDYFCGLKMADASHKLKKLYLGLSLTVNLGMLFIFKYLGFFTNSVNDLFTFFGVELTTQENMGSYNFSNILLPVGISFYTFQTLSYTIDIYRGAIKPERHFGIFALYVAFFPQLVAGPIERASRLIPQLRSHVKVNLPNIKKGLILIAWGFFLKVVVADRLGIYVDTAFAKPDSPHGFALTLGAIFFMFQIYFDFSAYTSIALGVAKTIGVELMQNFNRPIFATTVSGFWKSWHISLMQWLRDYVFLPLGGSRGSKAKTIRNVIILFFVVGLWHGASWTFVIWGLLNALLLILDFGTAKLRKKVFDSLGLKKRSIDLIGWFFGVSYIILTLVFFRAPSLNDALTYIEHMFQFKSMHVNILESYFELILSIIFILGVQTVHYYKGNDKIYDLVIGQPAYVRWSYYVAYVFIIALFAINRQNTFIYFQF
ncbi:MBOAT family O-acyltransferase [Flavobacteriaceae bacterium SZ-1-7]|uniref:MBOAT family O-acyltransferase n=1 Tax=Tamlana sedimenti TaxID=3134126 RepID=UPI00312A0C01